MSMGQCIPEVLSPAGDGERLDAALLFGADAVYLAGKEYGMRMGCGNFDEQQMAEAVEKVHAVGKKVYVTCNVLVRNPEIDRLRDWFVRLQEIGVDSLILADLGTFALAKKYAPRCALHVSTQMGVVNYSTAQYLYELGARRVVLARELSLDEIREIRRKTSPELELEAFVHGAICMSYSGRCVISNYLTGRDANHGECAQPCRWEYTLHEQTRPDQPLTLQQDESGTYLFNSNDLNMIAHVAELAQAGISSFKIEGRAKAAYYTAVTSYAYRQAVDGYVRSGFSPDYVPENWIQEEMNKISHRPYGTGFYFGMPGQYLRAGGYIRAYTVAAVVEGWENGLLRVSQRNRFFQEDVFDVLEPGKKPFTFTPECMTDEDGNPILSAPHATMTVWMPFPHPLKPGTLLRCRRGSTEKPI